MDRKWVSSPILLICARAQMCNDQNNDTLTKKSGLKINMIRRDDIRNDGKP